MHTPTIFLRNKEKTGMRNFSQGRGVKSVDDPLIDITYILLIKCENFIILFNISSIELNLNLQKLINLKHVIVHVKLQLNRVFFPREGK